MATGISCFGAFFGGLFAYNPLIVIEPEPSLLFNPPPQDSTNGDSAEIDLPFPFEDDDYQNFDDRNSPLYLNDPSNINSEFRYNLETGQYEYYRKIGDKVNYRNPGYMSLEEYMDYDMEQSNRDFWRQKSEAETINQSVGFRPTLNVKGELFDRIFGGNTIDIRPQGSAELSFGVNVSRRDNPILPERQRRTTTFDFDQKIQLNVIGNIGEKLKIQTSYNTEATFDFENQMKLEYTGYEDEIIQKIEAGNVALPLQSSLITGSQTLFGIKTELQFGRLRVTSVFSQERGEKKEINIQGGAQVQQFEKSAADYEDNKHYFLSHLFRESYEDNLSDPPRVTSRINITDVEVYITNTQGAYTNTRNVIGFLDLGNDRRIYSNQVHRNPNTPAVADNASNTLYNEIANGPSAASIRGFNNADQALQQLGFQNGTDYERLENAVLLDPSEYTVNEKLGYISLNRTLDPQDILAVAYRYTYNGQVYQVGNLSTDGVVGQDALYLKLLKGSIINTKLPNWDLMMKNVYSLDAFSVSEEDFMFQIWYLNPNTGVEIPYIPEGEVEGIPLLNVMNLDQVTSTNDQQPDGVFDFLPNITIDPRNGKIYFPVLEPFGSHIRSQFSDPDLADKYAFDSLYTTTQALAEQNIDKNRYSFRGQYQSASSSDISLNAFNIPEGSVVVTAGGRTLTENVDYTVDYNIGRVKILNEGILASGQPIKVSLGSNSLFNIQTKTLIGSRFDYRVSEDFNLGGTILNLTERPLTRKINIGDEPISNTVAGLDGTYRRDAPLLTRFADMLPFYETKDKSTITMTGEYARLFPGNSRAITKSGVAYIDDFEGSQSIIEVKSANAWQLASTPQGQDDLFPEANLVNDLVYGFNRAHLAWYTIDPLFFRNDSRTPNHIRNSDSQANNYSREVLETEVFPNKDPEPGLINNIPTLDLAFYPQERGQYNFDTDGRPGISAGLNPDGSLKNPESRWGGIMRDLRTSDFEASNIEYIQLWVMDPFNPQDGNPNHSGGYLYFNLGSISEDILKDGRKAFENGFPADGTLQNVDVTIWGRVPTIQSVVQAFNNDPESREFQDIGLDGVDDADESSFAYQTYLSDIQNILTPQAFNQFQNDPSNDNYHYYRGSDYDNQQLNILERYKRFNGLEGNSPTAEQSTEAYPTASTTLPDAEDLNQNFNMEKTEAYYQYKIPLTPQILQPENVGTNFITDYIDATTEVNGKTKQVRWYQLKIPIREPSKVVGNIQGFKSIRFMRMLLRGFDEKVILRFARLGLVRGEWRKYLSDELPPGEIIGTEPGNASFNISAVNLEENAQRQPINYVLPPDIEQETDFGTSNLRNLNEQSLVLDVCDLGDGFTKFAYRDMELDIRQYKKIKMFAHAEAGKGGDALLDDGDVSVVLRMGTDFDHNYYEYEVPLKVTRPGQNQREEVWPEENNFMIDLELLTKIKQQRNGAKVIPGATQGGVYEVKDGKNYIRVKGNPNLAEVRVIMIGVKNPKASAENLEDDGQPKCAEIWVNELRLSDFDNQGGWAAQGRITAQIASLGTATLTGSMSTPGWGSLEQSLNERQKETRQQYDLSTNVQLGELLPDEVDMSIPMYYSVSENIIRPEYNPYDPDIKLNELLNDKENLSKDYRDSIRHITEDYTRRRSVNFTNVKVNPPVGKEKRHFYDISNFSVNYAYTEIFRRNFNVAHDNEKTYRGGLNYSYSTEPVLIEPFKDVELFKENKAFQLLKDFNLNLMPSQFSFTTFIDRTYQDRQLRSTTEFFTPKPFYQKTFNWSRIYNLRYDITKSLIFNFSASNIAQIDEPDGKVDPNHEQSYERFKDTVLASIKNFGFNTNYNHNFDISYTLPLSKIPILDFVSANAAYSATYAWDLLGSIENDSLGSTIRNSNTKNFSANLNLTKLYMKSNYLRQLSQPGPSKSYRVKNPEKEEEKEEQEQENLGVKAAESSEEPDSLKKQKNIIQRFIVDNLSRTVMSLKSINANYSKTEGTILPNYSPKTNILGMDRNWNAPGVDFIIGRQMPGTDYLYKALTEDWLVTSTFVSGDFSRTSSTQYNLRAILEPIKGLRIELNANKTSSQSVSKFFFYDPDSLGYNFKSPEIFNGTFSMSFIGFNTAFVPDDEKTFDSETFQQLRANRSIISTRLGRLNPNSDSILTSPNGEYYAEGYGPTSQKSLLYSFLSAYSGSDPNKFGLKDFTKLIPLPNWNITYDGLSKLEFFQKYFQNITIGHRYTSTFSVGSYTRNPLYKERDGHPSEKDMNGNFINPKQIAVASISEQFSPLINIDMTWKNSLITRLEIRQDRNVSMSFTNSQITEVKGKEYVVGLGYRIKAVPMPFKLGGNRKASDLDLRADFSIRNNKTIIRKIVENRNELTAGQRILSIKFTADYRFSSRLNLRAYYDRVVNNPFISSTYPTANTNAGISLRFTLSQ